MYKFVFPLSGRTTLQRGRARYEDSSQKTRAAQEASSSPKATDPRLPLAPDPQGHFSAPPVPQRPPPSSRQGGMREKTAAMPRLSATTPCDVPASRPCCAPQQQSPGPLLGSSSLAQVTLPPQQHPRGASSEPMAGSPVPRVQRRPHLRGLSRDAPGMLHGSPFSSLSCPETPREVSSTHQCRSHVAYCLPPLSPSSPCVAPPRTQEPLGKRTLSLPLRSSLSRSTSETPRTGGVYQVNAGAALGSCSPTQAFPLPTIPTSKVSLPPTPLRICAGTPAFAENSTPSLMQQPPPLGTSNPPSLFARPAQCPDLALESSTGHNKTAEQRPSGDVTCLELQTSKEEHGKGSPGRETVQLQAHSCPSTVQKHLSAKGRPSKLPLPLEELFRCSGGGRKGVAQGQSGSHSAPREKTFGVESGGPMRRGVTWVDGYTTELEGPVPRRKARGTFPPIRRGLAEGKGVSSTCIPLGSSLLSAGEGGRCHLPGRTGEAQDGGGRVRTQGGKEECPVRVMSDDDTKQGERRGLRLQPGGCGIPRPRQQDVQRSATEPAFTGKLAPLSRHILENLSGCGGVGVIPHSSWLVGTSNVKGGRRQGPEHGDTSRLQRAVGSGLPAVIGHGARGVPIPGPEVQWRLRRAAILMRLEMRCKTSGGVQERRKGEGGESASHVGSSDSSGSSCVSSRPLGST